MRNVLTILAGVPCGVALVHERTVVALLVVLSVAAIWWLASEVITGTAGRVR